MVEDEKVVGFIDGYVPDDEWWYKEKVAYIDHLCVDKDYRNRGIATRLVAKFEEEALKKEARYVKLQAFPQNIPAITFYNKNKFECYSSFYIKELL